MKTFDKSVRREMGKETDELLDSILSREPTRESVELVLSEMDTVDDDLLRKFDLWMINVGENHREFLDAVASSHHSSEVRGFAKAIAAACSSELPDGVKHRIDIFDTLMIAQQIGGLEFLEESDDNAVEVDGG